MRAGLRATLLAAIILISGCAKPMPKMIIAKREVIMPDGFSTRTAFLVVAEDGTLTECTLGYWVQIEPGDTVWSKYWRK